MDCTQRERISQEQSLLDWARTYAQRGWNVFPVWSVDGNGICTCPKRERCSAPGKHPRTRSGLGSATIDPRQIEKWKWDTGNVAIRTGPESNLLVIDIDPRNGGQAGFRQLQDELGRLPECPVAATGGGGWHLFFAFNDGGRHVCEAGPGVDVKGAGGYIVAPPSLHKSGRRYSWHRPPDDARIPELPQKWRDFIFRHAITQGTVPNVTQGAQGTQGTHVTQGAQDISRGLAPQPVVDVRLAVEEAVNENIPETEGGRHWAILNFTRALKAIPGLRQLQALDLQHYFDVWHQRARATIGTKAYEDSWWDFEETWKAVKFAKGESTVTIALERAKQAFPPVAQRFQNPQVRLLVSLCFELSRETHGEPFYLSTRTVAGICETTPMTACRWMNGLCRPFLGKPPILELVERGTAEGRKASTYRYIAEDQE